MKWIKPRERVTYISEVIGSSKNGLGIGGGNTDGTKSGSAGSIETFPIRHH